MPEVGEHFRPGDDHEQAEPGVYRVVGTGDGVVLLRVADADGRRVHSGELSRVEPETLSEAFDPAGDPDAGVDPLATLRETLDGLYWAVRQFV